MTRYSSKKSLQSDGKRSEKMNMLHQVENKRKIRYSGKTSQGENTKVRSVRE